MGTSVNNMVTVHVQALCSIENAVFPLTWCCDEYAPALLETGVTGTEES